MVEDVKAAVEAPKKAPPFAAEVEQLRKLEAVFQKNHDAYEAAARDGSKDGLAPAQLVPHLVHNARVELGKAQGGMTAAIQALEQFLVKDAKARECYAVERAKKEQVK